MIEYLKEVLESVSPLWVESQRKFAKKEMSPSLKSRRLSFRKTAGLGVEYLLRTTFTQLLQKKVIRALFIAILCLP